MGIKTIATRDSIKIFGNPELKIENKITIKNLASYFSCSTRTIHRNIDSQLRKEIKSLNEEIQCTKLYSI